MTRILMSLLGVFVCLCCVSVVQAQQSNVSNETSVAGSFPRLVRFSGTLPERRGASASVTAARVSFAIYEDQAGGAALWSEVQDVRLDAQGRYSVLLGSASSDGLPAELFSTGGPRWLGVQVEGRQEESRVLLVAVPYALKAADSDTLGGKPATAFVASDQLKEQVQSEVKAQVTESGSATRTLVGTAPTPQALGEGQSSFLCNLAADCVAVTQSGTGVGLHATTPTGTSVLGELSGTTGAAVYGRATGTSGAASAVQGDAAAPNAVGVLGRSFGTTGTSKGVFGRSFSTSGTGVHGDATAISGATRGVYGTTVSSGGVGVYGQSAAATGFTTGVTGTVASAAGVGVLGIAGATTGATIGVQAKVMSQAGIALVADNTAVGGKIASFRINGQELASIGGTGIFAGNGSGLTNVHASNLTCIGCVSASELAADAATQAELDAEASARNAADGVEITTRSAADTTLQTNIDAKVSKSGDTMTGTLTLPANGLVAGSNQLALTSGNVGVGAGGAADKELSVVRFGTENTTNYSLHVLNSTTSSSGSPDKYGVFIQNLGASVGPSTGLGIANHSTNTTTDGASKTGLRIESVDTFTGGGGTPTANQGLRVLVGGADLNYAATFHGGNVGIGTDTPAQALDVVGNVVASGSVTATSFVGPLTGTASNLTCAGCVSASDVAADVATQAELDTEASTRSAADSTEATARTAADSTLQTNLVTESSAREAADSTLQTNLNNESSARAAADATLQANIDTKVSKAGDTMAGTLVVNGSGTGSARMGGATGCGSNYTGINLNGQAFSGCTNYNFLSSPTDLKLLINRPSGATIEFRENNTTQMTIGTNGNVGVGTGADTRMTLRATRSGTENTENYGLVVENNTTNTTGNPIRAALRVQSNGAVTTNAGYGAAIENLTTNATTDGAVKYGLYVASTGTFTGGGGTGTTNYGLYVAAPSGADSNYAAFFGSNVGIGTSGPLDPLHVAGNIRIGIISNGCVRDFEADTIAGTCSSDRRYKSNIVEYPAVLAKLAHLTPVTFNWRAEEFPEQHFGKSRSFGLIAQEVEEVFPDMVTEDAEGYKAVKYHKLPLLMLQGIRELKTENDELKQRVGEQQAEIGKLSEQLSAFAARLAELERARQ